jgi:hypothetical protein
MGPMTGRAAGYCAGYNAPGFANPTGGRGGGFGRGRGGRGYRNNVYATGLPGWQRAAQGMPAFGGMPPAAPAPGADERQALRQQIGGMEETLAAMKARLDELEGAE